jgi:hypothetical protein
MVCRGKWIRQGNRVGAIPFIFQPVPQLKDLDFNIALSIVLENLLVWLPLSML